MKKYITLLYIFLFSIISRLYAAEKAVSTDKDNSTIIIVMIISLLIWLGISVYIINLNRKIKILEKSINEK